MQFQSWYFMLTEDPNPDIAITLQTLLTGGFIFDSAQRYHHNLNRNVVLDWLHNADEIDFQLVVVDDGKFDQLLEGCGSDLERYVLAEIRNQNIRLPDEGLKIIYDIEGIPIASGDFFYEPKVIVFICKVD